MLSVLCWLIDATPVCRRAYDNGINQTRSLSLPSRIRRSRCLTRFLPVERPCRPTRWSCFWKAFSYALILIRHQGNPRYLRQQRRQPSILIRTVMVACCISPQSIRATHDVTAVKEYIFDAVWTAGCGCVFSLIKTSRVHN